MLFDCLGGDADEEGTDPFDITDWLTAGANNSLGATNTLGPPVGGGKFYVNGAAENSVTATDPTTIDPFFEAVDFIGAVPSAGDDFTQGWTVFLDQ